MRSSLFLQPFFLLSALLLAGCGSDPSLGSGDGEEPGTGAGESGGFGEVGADDAPTAGGTAGASGTGGGAGAPLPSTGEGSSGEGSGQPSVGPGVLTAGTWDDNRNYQRFLDYRDGLAAANTKGLLPLTVGEHDAAHAASSASAGPHDKLDIALIIDTTGSMGDEITYLQTEFDALVASIKARYPNAEQRWSLVVYRDTTDEYVTRWFDFRTNTADFRAKLAAQSVDGGGDFPEAPERGLARANAFGWRGDEAAKLAFWVADAPHHEENAKAMAQAIRDARDRGIHLYPVASSGVDELTEISMRSAAQLTGGRYIFLTDDSGVGNDHKEPSVPCYFVTKLDRAILRMVDIEMTGQYQEPDPADVIRTGGNPKDGVCSLEDGSDVTIF